MADPSLHLATTPEPMDAFLRDALDDWHIESSIRALCIESPPKSGKSTSLVPQLWNLLRDRMPGITGVYAMQGNGEAALLHAYFQSVGYSETTESPDMSESKIFLCNYRELSRMLFPDSAHDMAYVLPAQLALFLDVEPVPTAVGQLLLAQIIDSLQQLQQSGNANIAIVLLGIHVSRTILDMFEKQLHLQVSVVRFPQQQPARFWHFSQQVQVDNAMRNIINDVFNKNRQSGIVLFMPTRVATERVIRPALALCGHFVKVFYIHLTTNMDAIWDMAHYSGPKLVCIDPGATISLPPIKNIKLAMTSCTRETYSFDTSTSQHPWRNQELSRLELEQQRSVLWGQDCGFVLARDEAWFNRAAQVPSDTMEASPELILLAMFSWPRQPVNSMPLLSAVETRQLQEIARRLKVSGCVEGDCDTGFAVTSLGQSIVRHLRARPGWKNHLRLAYLSALSRQTLDEDSYLRRIMAMIVAISIVKPRNIFHLTDKGEQERARGGISAIMSKAREDCMGVGAQECHNGSIWLALGLLESLLIQDKLGPGCPPLVDVANGYIQVDTETATHVVDSAKNIFPDLPFGPDGDWDKTPTSFANADDRLRVYEMLAWSNLHQLLFFPNPLNSTSSLPIDMTSTRPVEIAPRMFVPVDIGKLASAMSAYPNEPGYAAFYMEPSRLPSQGGSGALRIMDLNLLPPQVIQRIETASGQKLSQIVLTTYPTIV